jgi:hypothetical protein
VKDGSGASPSQLREQEREIVADLCKAIIDIGREALATLENNAQYLPREHLIGGAIGQRYEMVSRSVSGVVRGLIDPELRDVDYQRASSGRQMDWPREVGELLVSRIIAVKINANGASVPLIPLDRLAINSLISMIEDFLK